MMSFDCTKAAIYIVSHQSSEEVDLDVQILLCEDEMKKDFVEAAHPPLVDFLSESIEERTGNGFSNHLPFFTQPTKLQKAPNHV
jgi:hypothetical protein